MIDNKVNAVITPIKTITPLYLLASNPEAICVLSPHSDKKIRVNPE